MQNTILIIGGTGVFGRRLASHLARTEGYRVALGSRSLARSEALAAQIAARPETKAALVPVAFDVTSGLAATLAEVRPRIVVDCSGPFQHLDYRTPEAVADAGADFVDLADARDYIHGFEAALDARFRSKGLVALTGASSSPALAASAVAALTGGWQRIDHIEIAIMPGGQSEVGEAAVVAALSYCGRPVPIVLGRKLGVAAGWGSAQLLSIKGLGCRTVAPVETADAELLHALYPAAASIRFSAGLGSSLEQWGLRVIASLHRWRVLGDPGRLAPLLTRARKLTRLFTGATGAMLVRVVGLDHVGRWTQAEWRLIAHQNQGPQVPPSPAAAAVRAILAGNVFPGARVALGLPLASIEAEFEGYAIDTAQEVEHSDRNVVQAAIGDTAFESLPLAIRAFHRADAPVIWSGCADVDGAKSMLGQLVARMIGLPKAGRGVPVTVSIVRDATIARAQPPAETWTRDFDGRRFASRLASSSPGTTIESFGPISFRIGLGTEAGRLFYPVTGWWLGPIPMPATLAPRSETNEWQDAQGRFNFDVRLSLPLLGTLGNYRGWLMPAETNVATCEVV